MKLPKLITNALFFLYSFAAFAQSASFDFKRSIEKPVDQWHRIELPSDLYQHVSPNLSDLRILGTNASGDSIEAPYIVETKTAYNRSEAIGLKIFNTVSQGGRHFFSFECPEIKELNDLELSFQEENFDWQVRLEGSEDSKDWFTISDNNRIVSIKNSEVNYSYSRIVFSAAKYRYYRISIPTKKSPKLLKAEVFRNFYSAGIFKEFTPAKMEIKEDKEAKKTIVDFTLPMSVPISWIKVEVATEVDYYRRLSLQYLADSIKSPKGWKPVYRNFKSAYLSSFENNTFNFSAQRAAQFRLVIENQDNAPLKISTASFKGHPTELIARFGAPADYSLYYGNKKLTKPRYDIASFRNTIPQDLKSLSLGSAQRLEKTGKVQVEALFTNKLWLYALMALIIFVVGGFTLKMMKESNRGAA